ncbi:MAG: hypothetical protein ACXVBE_15570, partial [Bdellovibrionota bacterium]
YDFAVADPTITSPQLDVVPGSTSKEVRVKPLRKGNAVVTVYDTAGNLRNKINYQFVSGVLAERLKEVRRLLGDVKGLTIEIVGDNIVFNGKLLDPNDTERVLQVQAAYVDHILNLAVDSQNLCKTRICREDPPPLPTEALVGLLDELPDDKAKAPVVTEKPKKAAKKKPAAAR